MNPIRSICVFCGSSDGALPEYGMAARELGRFLAEKSIRLVYGGASVGIMRSLADAVLAEKGTVIGVIPESLVPRVGHTSLTEIRVTPDMHSRKKLMHELSDAFIALPGGLGTLEEMFEALTWAQLGMHAKPCGFLNTGGFYDKLMAFLDHAVGQKLIRPEHRKMFYISDSIPGLMEAFLSHRPPSAEKWQ